MPTVVRTNSVDTTIPWTADVTPQQLLLFELEQGDDKVFESCGRQIMSQTIPNLLLVCSWLTTNAGLLHKV
jgi:hypothetical protein